MVNMNYKEIEFELDRKTKLIMELQKELQDAGMLHLADEQSIRNMQRVIDGLRNGTNTTYADLSALHEDLQARLGEAEAAIRAICGPAGDFAMAYLLCEAYLAKYLGGQDE
jgi:hypothetical protein